MAVTDSIGDMLTIIRNGLGANFSEVKLPSSKLKLELSKVLQKEGYLGKIEVIKEDEKPFLKITLKYGESGSKVINKLKRVSKPGRRQYVQKSSIPRVLSGFGINILSTSKGLMTGKQARQQNLGGEILCEVY